jgi:DEAD/DEAH box helicase domain-containing protein
MAELALDPQAQLSLVSPRWTRVTHLAAMTLQAARPGYTLISVAGLPALTNGTEVIIVTHPLWCTERGSLGPELAAAWDDAERGHHLRVDPLHSFISVFEALRRPA